METNLYQTLRLQLTYDFALPLIKWNFVFRTFMSTWKVYMEQLYSWKDLIEYLI